jgi:integration host factor subunit alpha
MTLTKTDLVKSVMDKVRFKKLKRERQRYLFPEFGYEPLTKQKASRLVDATFEIMKKSLENGTPIMIPGFGKFKVKFKWARKGRNPKTGDQIILDSRRIVTFRVSQKFKDKLNGR